MVRVRHTMPRGLFIDMLNRRHQNNKNAESSVDSAFRMCSLGESPYLISPNSPASPRIAFQANCAVFTINLIHRNQPTFVQITKVLPPILPLPYLCRISIYRVPART